LTGWSVLAEDLGVYPGKDFPSAVKQISRQVLEQIAALSSEGIIILDASDSALPIVYANGAYESLTGYGAEEVLGHSWRLLTDGPEDHPQLRELRSAMGRSEPWEMIVPDIRKDGTSWFSRVRVQPVYGRLGDLECYLCLQQETPAEAVENADVEVGLLQRELRRARRTIVSLGRVEPTSGALRYEYFMELAQRDFQIAQREGRSVAVMLFEIIDLDIYCQTFGPKAGESCVRMVAAQVISALRRAGDLCARAAETTLIALVQGQEIDEARALALRIAQNVRGLGLHNPRARWGRHVTVGIGVAGGKITADTHPETVIKQAEEELRSWISTQEAGSAS